MMFTAPKILLICEALVSCMWSACESLASFLAREFSCSRVSCSRVFSLASFLTREFSHSRVAREFLTRELLASCSQLASCSLASCSHDFGVYIGVDQ